MIRALSLGRGGSHNTFSAGFSLREEVGFAEGGAPACMRSDSGGSSCLPFVTRVHWAPGVRTRGGGAGIFLDGFSFGLRGP
ncbi:unnamed protein product [Brassica rapa]|uniref:Uncharacterized protein n=1 Tax=Brassica campestris TaxID=3711 RepID=A0A8D9FZU3_BRACM|nr:unnamed protein product [Brassica rapa]